MPLETGSAGTDSGGRVIPPVTTVGRTAKSVDWNTVWFDTRKRLLLELGEAMFDAWIAPLVLISADNNEVKIGAPKPFARNWVANHYTTRIVRAMRSEGGEPTSLTIVLSPPTIGGGLVRESQARVPEPSATYVTKVVGDAGEQPSRGLGNRMLHPSQTFDTFIAGEANEFSYKATQDFAKGETSEAGLLFIHGGFGYGKTHLLNATALEARKRGKKVLFLGAEDFMRQFLGALNRRDTLSFKEEIRAADMIAIDDLQHICRSSTTVAEFLHTVNAFSDLRRKVVIAADRAPAALEALGADIRSRLTGGLVICLEKPERATRLAILKARAVEFSRQRPDGMLSDEVLERIADLEDAAPRDLIGIFTKLATYADLTKKPVTLEAAEDAIGNRTAKGQKVSIEEIQRKTSEFYKLDIRDFHSPQRTRRVARPRQVAMYLCRELTMRSLPEIGRRFGGRDHTTVLHACRRVAEICSEDELFKKEVDFLREMLSRRV